MTFRDQSQDQRLSPSPRQEQAQTVHHQQHPIKPVAPPEEHLERVHRPILEYPGFDVLEEQDHWDRKTREVVLNRVYNVPPRRFFTPEEFETLTALCDAVLPQDDRPARERIPIAPWIDNYCYHHTVQGYRFEDMPPDEEAWRLGLRGLDETSQTLIGKRFVEGSEHERNVVLTRIAASSTQGPPPGESWTKMNPYRFWIYVAEREIVSVYYGHPTAWNEIGFGGPAYPRGYFALSFGQPEPWEVREVRFDAATR